MARTVEVWIWCDPCWKGKGVRARGRTVEVRFGDLVLGEFDLCQKHEDETRRAIRRALPRRRQTKREREGPFQCQIPDCVGTPLANRQSFWQHLRTRHHSTLDKYIAEYGELRPMTKAEQAAVVTEAVCPECGATYSTATGTRWPRPALVSHVRGRHGLKLMPDGTTTPIT